MMEGFDDQNHIGFTSYCSISDGKFLGRAVVWEGISKGLLSAQSRAVGRKKTSSFRSQCGLKQYIFIMIILLSGDISLNPGPDNLDNNATVTSNKFEELLQTRGLKVLHQNIRGLVSHKAGLEEFLSRSNLGQAHIIGISETHVNKDIRDSEIEIPGFQLNRNDRKNGAGGGGGVVVYVNESLTHHRRFDLEEDSIECVWVEVPVNKSKPVLVGNLYRPPDSSNYLPDDFNDKFDSMLAKVCCEDKETLLLGDFNCDYGKQKNNRPLKQMISSYGFCQQVDSPTRLAKGSQSLIDLVLSNMPQNICKTTVLHTVIH